MNNKIQDMKHDTVVHLAQYKNYLSPT